MTIKKTPVEFLVGKGINRSLAISIASCRIFPTSEQITYLKGIQGRRDIMDHLALMPCEQDMYVPEMSNWRKVLNDALREANIKVASSINPKDSYALFRREAEVANIIKAIYRREKKEMVIPADLILETAFSLALKKAKSK